MIETELKVSLDAAGMRRMKRHPALAEMRTEPRRTRALVSTYYDTPDLALKEAGVSLRLRRVGRSWVQTVKRAAGADAAHGLFSNREFEIPAPGGRLALDGADPDGALVAVREAGGGAPLAPVFETRVRRVVERLRSPEGGEVELALDEGEIRAGDRRAPILEAEMELVEGTVGDVFAVARRLFAVGPVRFASANKSARGYQLAATGAADPEAEPRNARTLPVDPGATIETVACNVLRDCLGQIAANMAVVCDSDLHEGPHQLRVGLRRLRTALRIFGPSLGRDAARPLADAAKRLGRVVGDLRDADVMIDEVVAEAAAHGLDGTAAAALGSALEERRRSARDAVRAELAAPETAAFLLDLARYIEARGWLLPSDHDQTLRLAKPAGEAAPTILETCWKKVLKRGRNARELDPEALHELRKELKTLRYAVDMLGPAFKARRVSTFLKELKGLQDTFGSMNDAAMAAEKLTGEAAPAPDDPAAQRAIGWTLGTLAIRAEIDRPQLFDRWDDLAAATPFWR